MDLGNAADGAAMMLEQEDAKGVRGHIVMLVDARTGVTLIAGLLHGGGQNWEVYESGDGDTHPVEEAESRDAAVTYLCSHYPEAWHSDRWEVTDMRHAPTSAPADATGPARFLITTADHRVLRVEPHGTLSQVLQALGAAGGGHYFLLRAGDPDRTLRAPAEEWQALPGMGVQEVPAYLEGEACTSVYNGARVATVHMDTGRHAELRFVLYLDTEGTQTAAQNAADHNTRLAHVRRLLSGDDRVTVRDVMERFWQDTRGSVERAMAAQRERAEGIRLTAEEARNLKRGLQLAFLSCMLEIGAALDAGIGDGTMAAQADVPLPHPDPAYSETGGEAPAGAPDA